jgi:hypothetical protein
MTAIAGRRSSVIHRSLNGRWTATMDRMFWTRNSDDLAVGSSSVPEVGR